MKKEEFNYFLSLIPEIIEDGVAVLEESGIVTYVSKQTCALLEVKRDRAIGLHFLDLMPPSARPVILAQFRRRSPEVSSYIVEWFFPDRRVKYIKITSSHVFGQGGEFQGVIAILSDISDDVIYKKQIETRLELEDIVSRISAEFINIKPDSLEDGISRLLKDIGMFFKSESACIYIFNGTDGSVERKYHWSISPRRGGCGGAGGVGDGGMVFTEDEFPYMFSQVRADKFIRYGGRLPLPPEAEGEGRRLASAGIGSIVWIPMVFQDMVTGFIGFQSDGDELDIPEDVFPSLKQVGTIISNALDRQKALLAIQKSERRYRTLFDTARDIIIILDQKGNILYVNRGAVEFTGFTDAEFKSLGIRGIVSPGDYDAFIGETMHLLDGVVDQVFTEHSILLKDGTTRMVETSSTLLQKGSEGKGVEILTVSRDITKHKELEKMLEDENLKLKEIDEMRRSFVATATHELKTPLVTINGATQFILQQFQDSLEQHVQKLILLIHRGGLRLKHLIGELVDFSKIEAGKLELVKQENDLITILNGALESVSYLKSQHKHALFLDVPSTLSFEFDAIKIEQVITNLLTNAIKNTPKGGTSKIAVEVRGDVIEFMIKDSGIGITDDEMEVLFQKFGKINRTGLKVGIDIQGSGLGLYISKQIIEAHRGKIWVESEGRNKGSTFHFTLPLR
ncbi:MAG: PAS domain S-box protein [Promethearchaeota archaeon]